MKKICFMLIFTLLCSTGIASTSIYSMEQNETQLDVYSPEFPELEVENSSLDLKDCDIHVDDGTLVCDSNDLTISSDFQEAVDNDQVLENELINSIEQGKELVGLITANVGVNEVYIIDNDGTNICLSSELTDPYPISECTTTNIMPTFLGKNNYLFGTQTQIDDAYVTHNNLVVSSGIYKVTPTSYSKEYSLIGIADWQSVGVSGSSNPATGVDFFGFVWGGNFSAKDKSLTLQAVSGSYNKSAIENSGYQADSTPQSGVVWAFKDNDSCEIHPSNLDIAMIKTTLYRKSIVGAETTVTAKYIHTYQSTVGSVTITAAPSFSLSSCSKQWSVVADLDEIPY